MLNKVILMGRLTKDPELRHTQSNIPVVSFTLAVDRQYRRKRENESSQSPLGDSSPCTSRGALGDDAQQSVDFINIVAWRRTAEFVSKWFSKGQLIAVSGMLQTRTYKDREGNNRTATEVVADEVYFAERKKSGAGETFSYLGIEDDETEAVQGNFEEFYGEDGEVPF